MNRILVIRGVLSTDELGELGLAVANKYEQATMVALVKNTTGILVKGDSDPTMKAPSLVEFIDVHSEVNRCANAILQVRNSYTASDYDHLSDSSVVGQFLFYWPIFETSKVVMDVFQEGDAEAVELAAEQFIRCGFGADLTKLYADEHRDASGHAADGVPS